MSANLWKVDIGNINLWILASTMEVALRKAKKLILRKYPEMKIEGIKSAGFIDAF